MSMHNKITNIKLGNTVYQDIADLAKQNSLPYRTAYEHYKAYQRGEITAKQVTTRNLRKTIKPITVSGVTYKDLSDLAKQNNLPIDVVRARWHYYKTGHMDKDKLIMPVQHTNKPKPINILGKRFKTRGEASRYFDRHIDTYIESHGEDWRAWPDNILNELRQQSRHPYQYINIPRKQKIKHVRGRACPITINNIHFKSISDAAKYCGITINAMRHRINHFGLHDPRTLEKHHDFILDGDIIPSISKLAAQLHTTPRLINKFIKTNGYNATKADLLKFIDKTRTKDRCRTTDKGLTLNGKYYKNMSDLARACGISRQTMSLRYKRYEKGEIDKEDLIKPIGIYKGAYANKRVARPDKSIKILDKTFANIHKANNYYSINLYGYINQYGRDYHNWPYCIIQKLKEKESE